MRVKAGDGNLRQLPSNQTVTVATRMCWLVISACVSVTGKSLGIIPFSYLRDLTSMTTPQQIGNNGQIPANWTQKDIQNSGLPRYAADDLDGIVSELSNGAGFTLVQGLAPTPEVISDVEECGIRLQKFGQDLGRLLPQNSEQEQLVEISDFSDEDEFDDRGYRSPGELTPHTDPPPIIALLCLRPAHSGGANRLVSAGSIRDAIRDEDPTLVPVLEAGFPYFMPDEKKQGDGHIGDVIPTLLDGPGGISCVYYRPFIERAAEFSGIPLPARSVAALDMFDRFANDAELQVQYTLEPGELLILNNYRVLHARDDYVDWPEKHKRRSLLRLWLDADWMPEPPAAHAGRRNPMADLL